MSYTPHTWAVGDVITAARLNALETGVSNAGASYDAVISADSISLDSASFTLEEGSRSNVISKIQNGEPVRIHIYGVESGESGSADVAAVFRTESLGVGVENSDVVMFALWLNPMSETFGIVFLYWISNGIVFGRFLPISGDSSDSGSEEAT